MKLPGPESLAADATPVRGIMLDLARLMDQKHSYFELLPELARWGYNLVHLHLSDDQGCRLKLPRRPELASRDAFSVEEMRAFIAEARGHGISVMPEMECLGHVRYIVNCDRYRYLAEPVALQGFEFNALCPHHPETRPLLADLLADIREVF